MNCEISIEKLHAAFSSVKRMTLEQAEQMEKMMLAFPNEILWEIFKKRVPFCTSKAALILRNRGAMSVDQYWEYLRPIVARTARKVFENSETTEN